MSWLTFYLHGASYRRMLKRKDHIVTPDTVMGTLIAVLLCAGGPSSYGYRVSATDNAHRPPRLVAPVAYSPPNTRPGLDAVSFANDEVGCAGGAWRILCTTDAGQHWVRRYAGPETVVGLDLVTPRVGWAVGVRTLRRTLDGGRTWAPVGEPTFPLRSVDVVTARDGWGIAGGTSRPYGGTGQVAWPFSGGRVVHTRDGGRTWAPQPAADAVDGLCSSGPTQGWAVHEARVWRTRDQGHTWRAVVSFPLYNHGAGWFASVGCAGSTSTWVLVSAGVGASNQQPYVLYRTGDEGQHWRPMLDEGYFEGASYPVYGAHRAPDNYICPLSVVDATTASIAGFNYESLAGSIVIADVRNGGQSLERRETAPGLRGEGPIALTFVDAAHGWVVGQSSHGSADTRHI